MSRAGASVSCRLHAAWLAATLLVGGLTGCDRLLVEPAEPPAHAVLAISAAPTLAAGPEGAAANRLRVQVRGPGALALDTLFLIGSADGTHEFVVPVPLGATPVTGHVEVELRADRLAVLRGATDVVLSRRQVTVAEIELLPVQDRTLAPVSRISAGIFHSCALGTDGRAFCWGDNRSGQLGDGGTRPRLAPVPVGGELRFREVAAAFATSCGLGLDGRIHCWGENVRSALGAGSVAGSLTPVPLLTGQRFAAMTIGGLHGCGLTEDGRAYCWGYNRYGQVGTGGSDDEQPVPVAVAPALRFRELSAGYLHTCGITVAERAYCWGNNEHGQAGVGAVSELVPLPAPVGAAGDRYVAIAAGGLHSCALTGTGEAHCWGYNAFGQVGNGAVQEAVPGPHEVGSSVRFRSLSAGGGHTCAVAQVGEAAYCWGHNRSGALGTGTAVSAAEPVAVVGGPSILRIGAGLHHTCAVNSAAESLCWGYNAFGQLGDRSTVSSAFPGYVIDAAMPSLELASVRPDYPAALRALFDAAR